MKKYFLSSIFFSLLLAMTMAYASPILAADSLVKPDGCACDDTVSCSSATTDECTKYCCGDYQINDFLALAVKFSKFILEITGALALLAFVVGGFMFLISAGNQDRVGTAKKIIIGAVIGIVVVFTSYIVIGFVFTAMGVKSDWASSGWTWQQ